MTKGAGDDDYVLSWEDLRTDAMQPRNSGSTPQPPVREFTIWRGDLGNFYSHAPVGGLDAVEGTAVNGALRSAELTDGGGSAYYLVSGRGDNLEGSLGTASDGVTERPGYAVTDLCDTIGTHTPPNATFLCGADFTLPDENGVERSLSDFRGHPIMLDLSAVWCGPCNTEADEMEQELQQVYRDLGAVILTALVDDNVASSQEPDGRPAPGDCLAWSNRTGTVNDHTFTCVADGNQGDYGPQAAWPVYGTGYLPTNVVLDQGFRVVYSDAGWYNVAPPHPKDDIKAVLDTLLTNENSCLK
jgi:thiol-disulfide isomerase/thioredoxin